MYLSFAAGALMWYPVGAMLSMARAAEYDGVELLLTPWMLRRGSEHYVQLALRHEMPILSIHTIIRYRGARLERQIAEDVASIAFAARIPGCRSIVLHPPMTGPHPSGELNRWLDAICEARAASDNPGIGLGLENRGEYHDGTEPQLLDDFERLRYLAGEWDLGITLDIAHAASMGVDIVEAARICASRLVNVHVSDGNTRHMRGGITNGFLRDHQIPGHGYLPIQKAIAVILASNPHSLLTVELNPLTTRAYLQPVAQGVLTSVAREMRTMIASAQVSPSSRIERRHPAR